MKNTLKGMLTKNKSQKNNKELVKKCMDAIVKNRVNKSIRSFNKNFADLNKRKPVDKNKRETLKKLINFMNKSKKQIPKMETESNKSIYCNIGCKDTILEPGLPDYIPDKMLKKYKDDPDGFMLKILKQQRKEIFKNKKNVLVDNFYEGISSQSKNKLIKEGAISKCNVFNEIAAATL
jgi:hypothetical protein